MACFSTKYILYEYNCIMIFYVYECGQQGRDRCPYNSKKRGRCWVWLGARNKRTICEPFEPMLYVLAISTARVSCPNKNILYCSCFVEPLVSSAGRLLGQRSAFLPYCCVTRDGAFQRIARSMALTKLVRLEEVWNWHFGNAGGARPHDRKLNLDAKLLRVFSAGRLCITPRMSMRHIEQFYACTTMYSTVYTVITKNKPWVWWSACFFCCF